MGVQYLAWEYFNMVRRVEDRTHNLQVGEETTTHPLSHATAIVVVKSPKGPLDNPDAAVDFYGGCSDRTGKLVEQREVFCPHQNKHERHMEGNQLVTRN